MFTLGNALIICGKFSFIGIPSKPLPVDALAHIISGAANEAAFWAARADDPETALSQAQMTMAEMIRSLSA